MKQVHRLAIRFIHYASSLEAALGYAHEFIIGQAAIGFNKTRNQANLLYKTCEKKVIKNVDLQGNPFQRGRKIFQLKGEVFMLPGLPTKGYI